MSYTMDSKGQEYVIKEFFSFVIGLALLISLAYIYINVLLPAVEELAYVYYSRDITAQVDYILMNVYDSVRLAGHEATAVFAVDMPKVVHDSTYLIYFSSNRTICVNIWERKNTLSGEGYVECRGHSIPYGDINLEGVYSSQSGKLKMTATKENGIINIELNKEVY